MLDDGRPACNQREGIGNRRDVRLMSSNQDTLSLVKSALPGRDSLIERAYRANCSFRGLCQDYRKCAEALERWRRSEVSVSCSRAQEYAELLAALAQEIESWLTGTGIDLAPSPGDD
jgi:hypothetical protein